MGWMRERARLHRNAGRLVGELGTSAPEVARTLEHAGARGYRMSTEDCPVANYLSAVMGVDPKVSSVSVTNHRLVIHVSGHRIVPTVRIMLPPAVRQFVRGFDTGAYPTLLKPPARWSAAPGPAKVKD